MNKLKRYLGEQVVDLSQTEYSHHSKEDWVLEWIEMYGGIDGDPISIGYSIRL